MGQIAVAQRHKHGPEPTAMRREAREEAIAAVLKEGRPINVHRVSKSSGVSSAWLYGHPNIKQCITRPRGQQMLRARPRLALPAQERRSDASKDAIIATLKERVKRLEAENREVRAQCEMAYGRFLEDR